ncbi:MAG: PDZ domain-containing protein [Pyrinomonadaceae bacterium]|nr:PDZ domain-containing protein [Pyrinomonadaceae bacterium]
MTISRENREQQLRVTLGELPAERMKITGDSGSGRGSDAGKLGLRVEPLTPALAERLNLPSGTQGLLVTDVDPVGPAADAGIRENDVIEEVNRQAVRSVADLQAGIQRAGTKPSLLLINRGGNDSFMSVRPRP